MLTPATDSCPIVALGYGKLTVTGDRQPRTVLYRGDTELAKWYTADDEMLDENIFIQLQGGTGRSSCHLHKHGVPREELLQRIFETISERNRDV
jgi:hypothetical protein